MDTVAELEEKLSQPSERLLGDFRKLKGDILILGVGGKMGPSLAKLAKRASESKTHPRNIIGVSRFSNPDLKEELEGAGIQCIQADLLNEKTLLSLPQVPNVIFMAGMKFGATGNEGMTWAMNTYMPGRVAHTFTQSRIVVFSTGNVYPLTDVASGGPTEEDNTGPIGEYAQSCLGRERIFSYFSAKNNTPMAIFRLNYAIDLRYGILYDVAKKVYQEETIALGMGYVNVIWQGDANEFALRSLLLCTSPPLVLNISGPETLSIRWLATQFGKHLGKAVRFQGQESATALLTNTRKAQALMGKPRVGLEEMIEWTAHWIKAGGESLNKPTHFQQRDGKF